VSDFDPLASLIESDPTSTPAEPVQPEDATGAEGQGQPIADQPSAVQPEGQGQPDAQTGLYDLSTVPEEYRSHVEQHLKDIERNANKRFQEAAEYRKAWEPYESLGINEVDPEGLSALMEFAQAIADPESARDAVLNLAQALELDLNATPEYDPDNPDNEPDPVEELRAKVEAIEQERAAQQEQAQIAQLQQQAEAAYRAEFAEVEGLNGKPFSQEEKVELIGLARRFQLDHDEPIKAAYQFINSIRGGAEKALVDSQPAPPAPAEPAGRASSAVQPVDSFEEALRLHMERNASASR
jgi:hypothetical protein